MNEKANLHNTPSTKEPTYLHALKEFFIAGLSFGETLASAGDLPRQELCARLLKITPLLYLKALMLEEIEGIEAYDEEDIMLPTYVLEEEYATIQQELEGLLGEEDYFLETIGEEMQFTDAPITARVSEYLADVYQPVYNLLGVVRDRNHIALPFAVTRCRRLFEEYWGDRLLAVMRPLHAILLDSEKGERYKLPVAAQSDQEIDLLMHKKIDAFLEGLDDNV